MELNMELESSSHERNIIITVSCSSDNESKSEAVIMTPRSSLTPYTSALYKVTPRALEGHLVAFLKLSTQTRPAATTAEHL